MGRSLGHPGIDRLGISSAETDFRQADSGVRIGRDADLRSSRGGHVIDVFTPLFFYRSLYQGHEVQRSGLLVRELELSKIYVAPYSAI